MKRISFLFLSFLTVFLISCEKEIQVEIADNEPKIVLSAHFGAGKVLMLIYHHLFLYTI